MPNLSHALIVKEDDIKTIFIGLNKRFCHDHIEAYRMHNKFDKEDFSLSATVTLSNQSLTKLNLSHIVRSPSSVMPLDI